MVPTARFELARPRGHRLLRPARIPVPPGRHNGGGGRSCTAGLRVMGPARCSCATPRRWLPGQGSNLGSLLQRQASYQLDDPASMGGEAASKSAERWPCGLRCRTGVSLTGWCAPGTCVRSTGRGTRPHTGGSDGCCPRDLPVDSRARCCCATEPCGLVGRICTAGLRLRRPLLCLLSYDELATTVGIAPTASAFAGRRSVC